MTNGFIECDEFPKNIGIPMKFLLSVRHQKVSRAQKLTFTFDINSDLRKDHFKQ